MRFFNSAVSVLQPLVIGLGAGLAIWGWRNSSVAGRKSASTIAAIWRKENCWDTGADSVGHQ